MSKGGLKTNKITWVTYSTLAILSLLISNTYVTVETEVQLRDSKFVSLWHRFFFC